MVKLGSTGRATADAMSRRVARAQRWREVRAQVEEAFSSPDAWACLISLASHLAILIAIALLRPDPIPDTRLTILVPLEDLDAVPVEMLDESVDFIASDDMLPEIGAATMALLEEAAPPPPGDVPFVSEALEADTALEFGADISLVEMFSNDSVVMVEEVAGIRGATVSTNGDSGSVQRITEEILTRLEEDRVLVVWLMDASDSLRSRREEIITRFDRVYDELDELLGEEDEDALLTSVYSFGQVATSMLKDPTADREQIQQSVRDIKADESGVENVFSAVKSTALDMVKFAREGRKVMMVVVTDERGDDLPVLDEALDLIQRHKMSVYVMGPAAPFGWERVHVRWVDRDTGEVYWPAVELGPETVHVEHARLGLWDNGPGVASLSSGFGPYGLTRITHENGGLYLLSDTNRLAGPDFEMHKLVPYRPDYVTPSEYMTLATKNPLRLAILRTAQSTNDLRAEPLQTLFYSGGIQFEIRKIKKDITALSTMINKSLTELGGVEEHRSEEMSNRWVAHYDLLMGRLIANQIRLLSCIRLLDEMYDKPKMPADGTKNAWELVGDKTTALVHLETNPEKQEEPATLARQHLQRVMDEHPDTPWASIAQHELEYPLTFAWQEAFMEPPPGEKLPWDGVPWHELTEPQREAKAAYDTRKAARAKRAEARPDVTRRRAPPKL